jgi:two-component system, OmpR family, phosphate regulon sensor histidine kinase PhoR
VIIETLPSRFTVALVLCGAAAFALVILSFWNPLAAAISLCAALCGALIVRLVSHQREERAASPPLLEASAAAGVAATLAVEKSSATSAAVSPGALLDATMNSMREGVLVTDGDMYIVALNRTARDIFGQAEGDRRTRRLSDLTRNSSIHSAFRAALEGGERGEVKVEIVGSERRIFDLRVAPLRLTMRGRTRGAIGVFFDITQLERLERVRQEFLSNVSHELRTPLTAIIAFVETLEEGAIDDSQNNRRFLSVIRKNAERMHNLIDDILELSAIEAGMVEVEPRRIRLYPLIEDVTTALASRAEARQVTMHNEVSPEAFVYADARRLEQMLTNLVDNAIKFNRENGSVTIRHEGGARDQISVTDTGDGISAEQTERIFERFYRIDRARSREMGGTGLGLAIVKHLARAHGGEATVHSTPGSGSTFTIELPKAVTSDE